MQLEKIYQAFQKFPVPMFFSVILTSSLTAKELNLLNIEETRGVIGLCAAFLVSTACTLYFLAKPVFRPLIHHLTGLFVGGVFFILIYFNHFSLVNYASLFLGLLLLLTVVPYWVLKVNDETCWLYNAQLFVAIDLGLLGGLIFGGGFSALFASFKFLFNISVPAEIYTILWYVALGFISPFIALSLGPLDFRKPFEQPSENSLASRGVNSVINYTFVPLLLVYSVVLHLYGIKILIRWDLPKGQVATLVLCFTLGLITFILFSRPWYEKLTKASKFLLNYWAYFLVVPVLLLVTASAKRITDYGITPERYGLLLAAFWIILLIGLAIIKKGRVRNVIIVSTITLMLLFTSFGPWGAVGLSLTSQSARLIKLLEKKQILKNGVLPARNEKEVTFTREEIRQAQSILKFLRKHDGLNRLKPVFQNLEDSPFYDELSSPYKLSQAIEERLGFSKNNKGGRRQESQKMRFSSGLKGARSKRVLISDDISYLGNFLLRSRAQKPEEMKQEISYAWHDGEMLFIQSGAAKWKITSEKIHEVLLRGQKQKTGFKLNSAFSGRSLKIKNEQGHQLTIIIFSSSFKKNAKNHLVFEKINFSALAKWKKS